MPQTSVSFTPSHIFCEAARGNVTLPLESPPSGGDLNRQRCKAGLGLAGPAETRMFLERWNQIDMILLVSWSADSPVSHDK